MPFISGSFELVYRLGFTLLGLCAALALPRARALGLAPRCNAVSWTQGPTGRQ
jgi:hypothetical protein